MATIALVLRDEKANPSDTPKQVYVYNALTYPHIGEYVEVSGHVPYVVERVIHRISNGNDIVTVEVKKLERKK